ncbi:MAG TPA: Fur family transcriptional regulator [Patescibacteria group bacterium]|nr:Fur family transcriptional regulator [Patescibacteria group bacterium]
MLNCEKHSSQDRKLLKSSGLKVTRGRLEFLDALAHAGRPLSISAMSLKLGDKGVDLATLYRNADALEQLGLIKRVNLNSREAYYELSGGRHHHHLTCVSCGRLEDLDICGVRLSSPLLKKHGFKKLLDHSLEFFGLCAKCAKASR